MSAATLSVHSVTSIEYFIDAYPTSDAGAWENHRLIVRKADGSTVEVALMSEGAEMPVIPAPIRRVINKVSRDKA